MSSCMHLFCIQYDASLFTYGQSSHLFFFQPFLMASITYDTIYDLFQWWLTRKWQRADWQTPNCLSQHLENSPIIHNPNIYSTLWFVYLEWKRLSVDALWQSESNQNTQKHVFQSGDLELWPMTLTIKLIQDIIKSNPHTKLWVGLSHGSAMRALADGQTDWQTDGTDFIPSTADNKTVILK